MNEKMQNDNKMKYDRRRKFKEKPQKTDNKD